MVAEYELLYVLFRTEHGGKNGLKNHLPASCPYTAILAPHGLILL